MLNNLINSLITAGGLGFINLLILMRIDKINFSSNNKEDKAICLIFFSIVNYGLFLLMLEIFKFLSINKSIQIPLSIISVIIISILLTFFVIPPLSNLFSKSINNQRKKEQLSIYDSRPIKKIAFNFKINKAIYIFDFENNLISSGMSGYFSNSDDIDFEIILSPFNEVSELNDYNKLISYISSPDVESDIYLNIDKKIKIIILD